MQGKNSPSSARRTRSSLKSPGGASASNRSTQHKHTCPRPPRCWARSGGALPAFSTRPIPLCPILLDPSHRAPRIARRAGLPPRAAASRRRVCSSSLTASTLWSSLAMPALRRARHQLAQQEAAEPQRGAGLPGDTRSCSMTFICLIRCCETSSRTSTRLRARPRGGLRPHSRPLSWYPTMQPRPRPLGRASAVAAKGRRKEERRRVGCAAAEASRT